MDKSEAIKIGKEYKNLVNNYFDVENVVIFGSYSKGTQNENSDIDIAVIVKDMPDNYFETMPLLWRLRRQVSNLIEPIMVCRKNDTSGFLDEIMQYGIVV